MRGGFLRHIGESWWARFAGGVGCGLVAGLVLASCELAPFPEPPTPIPLPTPAGRTPQGTEAEPTVATPQEVTATPTGSQPRPTLPPTAEWPPLERSEDLEITWLAMHGEQIGWGIGAGDDGIERLLRTSDGGRTWRDVSAPALEGLATAESRLVGAFESGQVGWSLRYIPIEPAGPSTREIAVVWRTRDAGESWTPGEALELPFVGSPGSPPYLRLSGDQQVWLMARTGGQGMHRYPAALLHSPDGGATWDVLEDPFEGTGLQSCYKSGFAVHGRDDGLVTLESCPVEGAEVRFTRDGGLIWEAQQVPAPESAPDLFQNAGCESRSPHILNDTDWALAVVCRPFEGDVGERWFLYLTADSGDSWRGQSYPGGELLFLDPDTVWALSRELHLSRDGGDSWELVKRVFWDGQFSFVSQELGWAVARDAGEIALVRTEDGAQSWQIVEPQLAP